MDQAPYRSMPTSDTAALLRENCVLRAMLRFVIATFVILCIVAFFVAMATSSVRAEVGLAALLVLVTAVVVVGRALADVDHVEHAITFLRARGRLVAVMGAGVLFRKDRRAAAFRERIATMGGAFEELPAGSFRESGTDVNAVVLTVEVAPC